MTTGTWILIIMGCVVKGIKSSFWDSKSKSRTLKKIVTTPFYRHLIDFPYEAIFAVNNFVSIAYSVLSKIELMFKTIRRLNMPQVKTFKTLSEICIHFIVNNHDSFCDKVLISELEKIVDNVEKSVINPFDDSRNLPNLFSDFKLFHFKFCLHQKPGSKN